MRRTSRLAIAVAIAIAVVAVAPTDGGASGPTATEYEVKAAFVFNFMKLVEWPDGILADETAPIRLVIVGEDPFGEIVDRAAATRVIHGRKVVVSRIPTFDGAPLADAHVVFVARSERRHLAGILSAVPRRGALTIGDFDRFAADGGMIGLVVANDAVRFEINLRAAQAAGLTVSSRLLKLANSVHRD